MCLNYSRYQISTLTYFFNFLDQICPKRVFRSKTEKVNINISIFLDYTIPFLF